MKDYVKAVAAHSQTSEDMAAVIGIGVLAVCLQGKFLVQGTPGYSRQAGHDPAAAPGSL